MGLGKKCTSGSGDPDSPKASKYYLNFMSNTPNAEGPIQAPAQLETIETYLQNSTWGDTIQGYALTLHSSICEVMRISFEHRELDLDDDQTYAYNVLITLIQQLGVIISGADKS
jgi:hypothetical protein